MITTPIAISKVMSAEGNSSRQPSLPASKSHIENHQNAVATASAAIATKPVPPTRSSHGCVHAPAKLKPSAAARQTTRRGVSRNPRPADFEDPPLEFLNRSGGRNAAEDEARGRLLWPAGAG